MANHSDLLVQLRACSEAREWYDGKDSYRAWQSCPRGDWLLWIAAKLGVDRKLVVLAACDCAEQALRFVPDGENRPRAAIETARKWAVGLATIDEVRAASSAASAASAAAYSASAAAAAAYAASSSAAYSAYAAARSTSRKELAKLVRRRISWSAVKAAIDELKKHSIERSKP